MRGLSMRPLRDITPEDCRFLRGLLFDLDDTFLDAGKLREGAYSALFRLRDAGFALVAVTGRPSAWGKLLARQWPVDGIVTENGALFAHDTPGGVVLVDSVPAPERAARKQRLAQLIDDMRSAVSLEPAHDALERQSDFTFDIGEQQHPDADAVEQAATFARAHGAATFCSSVQLHVTYDRIDKAAGAVRFLCSKLGEDPSAALGRYAFIGDSANDASCFAAFRTSIAVSNLQGRMSVPPRYQTSAPRAAGFAEAAATLIGQRQ